MVMEDVPECVRPAVNDGVGVGDGVRDFVKECDRLALCDRVKVNVIVRLLLEV